MKTKQTKKPHYINNADFCKSLIKYKEDCKIAFEQNKPKPRVPNYIGECFMKIAEGLSHKPNFINYTYRDEMIADGIENCLMYFENFDPNISKNAFAYFTQFVYFAFLRRIKKEKKQLYVKYKTTEQYGIIDEHELMEMEDGHARQFQQYDNIATFIQQFEESMKKKKPVTPAKIPAGIELFVETDTIEFIEKELEDDK